MHYHVQAGSSETFTWHSFITQLASLINRSINPPGNIQEQHIKEEMTTTSTCMFKLVRFALGYIRCGNAET